MSTSNGHHQEVHRHALQSEPSLSFQVGTYLAISDAETWGNLPDAEIDVLATISFQYATLSMRLDKEDFTQGFKQSYSDWLNGLV